MTRASSTAVRTHHVAVPERITETPEARKADYSTAVRLEDGPRATPEQWARGCLEGAPRWLRMLLVFGWRHVLRLRLGPLTSAGTVLGWYVVEGPGTGGDDVTTLSVGSSLLEAQHHFLRDGDAVTWVTVVRTHTRLGRTLWRLIAPLHERSMPLLMRHAVGRVG